MSYFHFMTSLKTVGDGYNGPWEFFAKLFVEGNGMFFKPRQTIGPQESITSAKILGTLKFFADIKYSYSPRLPPSATSTMISLIN